MFSTAMRTCGCGEFDSTCIGREIELCGWVNKMRDHGNLVFADIRDITGTVQVFSNNELMKELAKLRSEDSVHIKGIVRARPDEMKNRNMATGGIEVECTDIEVLSASDVPPFVIEENVKASEDLRLKYRYLDLRRGYMQEALRKRSEIVSLIRNYLTERGFLEIETPIMSKSTPEGARDYLVPSRVHPGKFYALVQSPQLYKQLLMISGFDRYFQIARCFRDEDLRADRQPEHTQIDIEMSFIERQDIFRIIEGMINHIFDKALSMKLPETFPVLTYDEVINRFGTDKPDMRFELEINDITQTAKKSESTILNQSEYTGCLIYENDLTRKEIDALTDYIKSAGAAGLGYIKMSEGAQSGPFAKFLNGKDITDRNGIILIVSGKKSKALQLLGMLRTRIGELKGLYNRNEFKFLWVADFPLFERNEDENRWEACHHMFTMPKKEYLGRLSEDPGAVKGDLYDLVCNGTELASGSIRIHNPAVQKEVMQIVGMTEDELREKFGFFLDAFKYGAPPHGGIAPGVDRLVMLMLGRDNIRDVIAFPKTLSAVGLMEDTPSPVGKRQLEELSIESTAKEKK